MRRYEAALFLSVNLMAQGIMLSLQAAMRDSEDAIGLAVEARFPQCKQYGCYFQTVKNFKDKFGEDNSDSWHRPHFLLQRIYRRPNWIKDDCHTTFTP